MLCGFLEKQNIKTMQNQQVLLMEIKYNLLQKEFFNVWKNLFEMDRTYIHKHMDGWVTQFL